MIPFDPRTPHDPSGLRLGTPALTTRGLGKIEMKLIADFMHEALTHPEDEAVLIALRKKVKALAKEFAL